MYAVIETGGKQYRVSVGDVIEVEKLSAAEGDKVELPVIMLADDSGVKAGADVSAKGRSRSARPRQGPQDRRLQVQSEEERA